MKLEVLVSTMNQIDMSLVDKMNIKTDAVVINQTSETKYEEVVKGNKVIRLLSNMQRGLSRSRNQALLYSNADICLIADDDIRYKDDYEEKVLSAFKSLPNADIIIFNTSMINYSGKIKRKDIKKIRRSPKYKNYGSVRIAFKRKSFLKNNIWFNIYFGAGSIFGAGEETLVIREANKLGLRIYEYPENIADVDYSVSSWFEGYNEKYFYDKAAFLAAAYPKLKYLLMLYYIFKFRNYTNLNIKEIFIAMKSGFKGYNKLQSFEEYTNLLQKKCK